MGSCSLAVQQMVAIARAVDMKCKVLILDEPTSSLDDNEVNMLFELMRSLKKQGVGIIFVTHFLEPNKFIIALFSNFMINMSTYDFNVQILS